MGRTRKPPVLLAHATGFHARCWDAVVRELNPAQRVIAVDMRGHGTSTKQGPFDWDQFGADVARFAEALALRDIIGVGHSFGGHAITAAAASHPARFARLLLVDPVILSPERYASFTPVNDHPVARRRNEWASAEQMFYRFADRHPFRLWRRDVLMDYCRHGLVPTAGGFALACPPSIEAAIYKGQRQTRHRRGDSELAAPGDGTAGASTALARRRILTCSKRRASGANGLQRVANVARPGGGVSKRTRRLLARANALHPDAAPGLGGGAHQRTAQAEGRMG